MKNILVTGGAGEIGSAICRKFATEGYNVIITYNSNQSKAETLVNSLPPGDHSIFYAPNTNATAINKLKSFVKDKYHSLDILVNNAGITIPVPHDDLESLTDDWIDKIMQTNFRGSFAMVRSMKDLMISNYKSLNSESKILSQKSALIVNISSIAGIYGVGSNIAYCASKAALDSMTRSLARALAPNIRVVSVSPGFVEGEYTKNFDPNFLNQQLQNTPMGRFAVGEDVANAVYALATSLTFSTGNIITVDGGRLLK